MRRHIIHFAVKTGGQPLGQPRLGVAGVGTRKADVIETELAPPAADFRLHRRPVAFRVYRLIHRQFIAQFI
jgi:hypothetical protein